MTECLWCDKSLPGDAIPACGNCLLRTREEALGIPAPHEESEKKLDSDFDISKLAEPIKPKYNKGNTSGEVKHNLYTKTLFEEHTPLSKEIPMKMVKVKSNSIRSRQFVVDDKLVLSFDENGIAECLESDVYLITAYSRVRPGRLTIVKEPKKAAPAPAPAPKKVEPKVEEEKVVVPKTKTKTESKKGIFKKVTPKKDSE